MDLVGATIRSIRLLGRLGEGGMGVVYVGLDERLGRRVAVKAIRDDRRMDDDARNRFLREARVLSQLEHPNICRLYDYIEDDQGQFLVLELVPGVSLRSLINQNPPFARRLETAIGVAEALVAAHAMSVVHRDLKPENVMVLPDGQVKVLDFGLAREAGPAPPGVERRAPAPVAAAGDGGERTAAFLGAVTGQGAVMGTPSFMSPEQARDEPLTAASDMYSFGVLLQELFTGRSPYGEGSDPQALVQRAMWGDTEPVRGVGPHLAALIERLKSLAPGDRPSAQAAAGRLRWIAAAPQRRRRAVIRAAVLTVLVAAAVASTLGFVGARRSLRRAEASEREALRLEAEAQAVNSFLRNMLTSPDPARRGREVKVIEVLAAAAETADADFADQPANRAAVLETLGRTYHALGELGYGHEMLSRALALRREQLGPRAPETLEVMHHLGRILGDMDHSDQAESMLRETLSLREEVLGAEHPATLETIAALARQLHGGQRLSDSEALYRRAYEGRRRVLGDADRWTLESMRELGMVLRDERRFDEAEPLLRDAYEQARARFGVSLTTLDMLHSLARLYQRQGRLDLARPLADELHANMRELRGTEHPATLKVAMDLGRLRADAGELDEARELLEATLAAQRRVIGPAHRDTLETMKWLGYVSHREGRTDDVNAIFRERVRIAREHLGDDDQLTLECMCAYADGLRGSGRLAEAERLYRTVLETRRRVFGEDHVFTNSSRRELAKTLRALGRTAEASALEPAAAER